MPTFFCLNCEKEANQTCNCCQLSHYCSRKCQKTDWLISHRYESILFKAGSGETNQEEKVNREKRGVKNEKLRQQYQLLRKEYHDNNQRLTEALKNKQRSKREMKMTHDQRKKFIFYLNTAMNLKEEGKNDEKLQFLESLVELSDQLKGVPLRGGEIRSISMGDEERLQLAILFRKRDILNTKVALILATRDNEISREASEYRAQLQEEEKRFLFQLCFRESDGLTYEQIVEKQHREISDRMVNDWIEKAYKKSIGDSAQAFASSFDELMKGAHHDSTDEMREKEFLYLQTKLEIMQGVGLENAEAKIAFDLREGRISEEAANNARSHYRRISERIKTLLSEENQDQVIEDFSRKLRGYFGSEWRNMRKKMEDAMSNEKEEGVKVFGGLYDDLIANPVWSSRRKFKWAMIIFFSCWIITNFIMYCFGFVSNSISTGEKINIHNLAITAQDEIRTTIANSKNVNEDLVKAAVKITEGMSQTKMTDYTHFYSLSDAFENKTPTHLESQVIAATVQGQINIITDIIANETSLGLYGEDQINFLKTIVEAGKQFLSAASLGLSVIEQARLLKKITGHMRYSADYALKAGMVASAKIMENLFLQFKSLLGIITTQSGIIDDSVNAFERNTAVLKRTFEELKNRNEILETGSPFFDYYMGDWSGTGYKTDVNTVTPLLTGSVNTVKHVGNIDIGIGDILKPSTWKLSGRLLELHLFKAFRQLPPINMDRGSGEYIKSLTLNICRMFFGGTSYIPAYYLVFSGFKLLADLSNFPFLIIGNINSILVWIGTKFQLWRTEHKKATKFSSTEQQYIRDKRLLMLGKSEEMKKKIAKDLFYSDNLSFKQYFALLKTESIEEVTIAEISAEKCRFIIGEIYSHGIENIYQITLIAVIFSYWKENWEMVDIWIQFISDIIGISQWMGISFYVGVTILLICIFKVVWSRAKRWYSGKETDGFWNILYGNDLAWLKRKRDSIPLVSTIIDYTGYYAMKIMFFIWEYHRLLIWMTYIIALGYRTYNGVMATKDYMENFNKLFWGRRNEFEELNNRTNYLRDFDDSIKSMKTITGEQGGIVSKVIEELNNTTLSVDELLSKDVQLRVEL